MKEPIEYFGNGHLIYGQNYLLHAEFTDDNKLLLEAKPSVDLKQVLWQLRNEIMDLANLEQHLDIYLYHSGARELIEISVN